LKGETGEVLRRSCQRGEKEVRGLSSDVTESTTLRAAHGRGLHSDTAHGPSPGWRKKLFLIYFRFFKLRFVVNGALENSLSFHFGFARKSSHSSPKKSARRLCKTSTLLLSRVTLHDTASERDTKRGEIYGSDIHANVHSRH
jgi:hypothetical protein